jgi:hypothetical protein
VQQADAAELVLALDGTIVDAAGVVAEGDAMPPSSISAG